MERNVFCLLFISQLLWKRADTFITFIEPRSPLQGEKAAPGSPWPMPFLWRNSSSVLNLHPDSFKIVSNLKPCDVIDSAILRYFRLIFPRNHGRRLKDDTPEVHKLQLTILSEKCDVYPTLNNDESYELKVIPKEALLTAQTVWGALRGEEQFFENSCIKGIETFSQLVYQHQHGLYLINRTHIRDKPRFQHRGLLLDTARHFIPLHLILTNLDAMSYNKMNVFHWHLVDDQSFPYESRKFPKLAKMGAYSLGRTYSQQDVARVIEYARKRGIRVIPEFDTPGHTYSWGKAFPGLLTPCYVDGQPGKANYTEHHTFEVLNPIQEDTYGFLNEFFGEIIKTFPDTYVHLGMDEVYYACWKSNPQVRAFMVEKGFGKDEFFKLEQYYIERVMEIVTRMKASYIIWQDPIENGVLPKSDTLIQIWKDTSLWDVYSSWQNYSNMVAEKGYKMILSSCWYLNYINYGPDWQDLYMCEPLDFTDDPKKQQLIIGGEACMWSEYVDETNIMSRIWPRASAIAERLWSRPEVNDVNDAQFRLDQQRCRLLRRGISAQPILNGYCEDQGAYTTKKMAVVWSCADRLANISLFSPLVILAINHFI